MKLSFEYGGGLVEAELPENTDVFIPGKTAADPPCIPEAELEKATRESLRAPLGMPPLADLAFPGAKCVVVFPDRVKGGEQKTSHRKTAIPLILEELYAAGVRKQDIILLCAIGLHRKNTEAELRGVLGDALYDEFNPSGQIVNHDAEDSDHLVDIGPTPSGNPVIMNKHVFDADVAVLVGHTQGNPYGGYSGGYKHCATGITHWKSIAGHHVPSVMHRGDFTPVSGESLMRRKFDEIGAHMEDKMGKKFFCCDAVLDTSARQIAVFSGWAKEVQEASWKIADKRTYVKWAEKKYDVMVFGMPSFFHYGEGMGTNPIMMMQAISAQVVRHRRILNDGFVIICASLCDGNFHEELFPYTREMYDIWQSGAYNTLADMNALGENFALRKDYIDKYRFHNAYHPFHGFSMISSAHIAEMHAAAVYIAGAKAPGYARGMGLKTRASIEEALADAKLKYTGQNPAVLALPLAFKTAAVHLCMKD